MQMSKLRPRLRVGLDHIVPDGTSEALASKHAYLLLTKMGETDCLICNYSRHP